MGDISKVPINLIPFTKYGKKIQSNWLKTKEVLELFISLDKLISLKIFKLTERFDRTPSSR